ncbi:APC family permease [Ligilactobacillus sp. WILCCON 0076]|uniref:APC family permease n=1 Tax=Ligilactobacillus ubinensis TaxID=2876789 RepID=A0A9X2FIY3_9LACO|nr:APC family permease [Ligilactobacillus ubinensis]MCP0886699.1 APC family permease [Ligilactobacillus ubinensis]
MQIKRHKISLFSAVMLALGSLIGSGWLFGAGEAARVAGPAAIISWVLGAIIIMIIAFNYVELGTMFPESGGMSRYAQYSHGPLLGFIAAWANWISLITLVPIEAVASVEYMSTWPWEWANWTKSFMHNGSVSGLGIVVVVGFMLFFTLLNFWSVKILTRFTSLISFFKIGMPTLTIIMLLCSGFHTGNFGNSWHSFAPYGLRAVFEATTVSGIIFSYDAFQTIINMGGEVEKPHKNIARGIAISLTITAIIYILLQVAFIGAVKPSLLNHGWQGVNFSSPFADLAILVGLNWLSVLLYIDAFVSPFGTGVAFVATAARTLASMTKNGHVPTWLGRLERRYMVPRFALIADFILSVILVLFFRNWSTLASVISASTLIAYLTGPVTAFSLRKLRPNFKRPVKSKLLPVLAPTSFVLTSLAIYWAMWPTTIEVIFVIALGLPIYFYYEWRYGIKNWKDQVKGSLWMIVYLIFISTMSYIGSTSFGGKNILPYPTDFIIIIVVSLLFYRWAIKSSIEGPDLKAAKEVNDTVELPD